MFGNAIDDDGFQIEPRYYLPIIPNQDYKVNVNLSLAVRSINSMNQVDGNLESCFKRNRFSSSI